MQHYVKETPARAASRAAVAAAAAPSAVSCMLPAIFAAADIAAGRVGAAERSAMVHGVARSPVALRRFFSLPSISPRNTATSLRDRKRLPEGAM